MNTKRGMQFKCCYASHYIIFYFQISRSSKTWQPLKIKNAIRQDEQHLTCGERGIRTLDKLLTYTHFPGVLLKPLGHLSNSFLQRSWFVLLKPPDSNRDAMSPIF